MPVRQKELRRLILEQLTTIHLMVRSGLKKPALVILGGHSFYKFMRILFFVAMVMAGMCVESLAAPPPYIRNPLTTNPITIGASMSIAGDVLEAGTNFPGLLVTSQVQAGGFYGSGFGMTNYGPNARAGYPTGPWIVITEGDSISVTPSATTSYYFYLTNQLGWSPGGPFNVGYLTNTAVSGQTLFTVWGQYAAEVKPWLDAYDGSGTNVLVILQSGNHDFALGTNSVTQTYAVSNYIRNVHLDGGHVLLWDLHSYFGETTGNHDEKQLYNMILRDHGWWDWLYPFSWHFGSLPHDQISTDGVHPNSNGARRLAYGVDKVMRSGRGNPLPIWPMLPPQGSVYGVGNPGTPFSSSTFDHTFRVADDLAPGIGIFHTGNNALAMFKNWFGEVFAYYSTAGATAGINPISWTSNSVTIYNRLKFPTNSAAMPTAALIGAAGSYVIVNSNGVLVTIYTLDGSATAMKVLAP